MSTSFFFVVNPSPRSHLFHPSHTHTHTVVHQTTTSNTHTLHTQHREHTTALAAMSGRRSDEEEVPEQPPHKIMRRRDEDDACADIIGVSQPYNLYSDSHKRKIRAAISNDLSDVFTKYGVLFRDDMQEILSYFTKQEGIDVPEVPPQLEEAIRKQLKTLPLPKRYEFHRLLTHCTLTTGDEDGAVQKVVNEDILKLLPTLRERSEHILEVDRNGRKERNDKLDLDFINEYMHDYCRVNTFDNKVLVGKDCMGNKIYHAKHEYSDVLDNVYENDFLLSEEYKKFQMKNGNRTIGRTKFFLNATKCECISRPNLRACVDEIEVNMAEAITALRSIHRSNQQCSCMFCCKIRETKEDEGELSPLTSVFTFLRHVIPCPKVAYPCADKVVDVKIFKKSCCYEACQQCAEFERSAECVFQCPTLFNANRVYKWKEFEDHSLDNGSTIRELRIKEGRLELFKMKFMEKLRKYKVHFFIYKWLDLQRKFDVLTLTMLALYIHADYSAQVVLESQDKLNSQGHGVCVLSCWVVLHSPEVITYEDEDGAINEFTYYECDHIRVVSPARGRGKDQDWYLHGKTFDFLLTKYKATIPDLSTVLLWTDGAVNQYKCRQNFFNTAQIYRRHKLVLVHRFAATAQFKGVHDKVGQVAKWSVR